MLHQKTSPAGPCREDIPAGLAYVTLAVVTLIGAFLRISYIDETMTYDEAYFAEEAHSRGLWGIATYYRVVGNHILHTLAVAASQMLFGPEPWSVRLPALVVGIALTPATYMAASILFGRQVAIIASGLVAGSPYLTYYSVSSRGYALQCLLVILLLWLLERLTRSPTQGLRLILAAGIVGALAMYTLPTTLLVLPGLYAGMALQVASGPSTFRLRLPSETVRRLLAPLLLTGGLSLILYMPVLITNGWEYVFHRSAVVPQPATMLWERFVHGVTETASRWTWDLPAPIQILFALVAGLGLLDLIRRQNMSGLLVVLVIAGTLATSLALRRVPPYRGYFFLMPFFLMMFAVGIQTMLRWLPTRTSLTTPLMAVLMATGGTLWTWSGGWLPLGPPPIGYPTAAKTLGAVMGQGISVFPAYPQLRYYSRLYDLGLRFRGVSEDHHTVYWIIRTQSETLAESIEHFGLDDEFTEPRLFREFPNLQVFVVHRKPDLGNGWYPEETATGSKWRWTGRAATLTFRNPRADATLFVDYAARPDLFATAPQVVTIRLGDRGLHSFVADNPGRKSLRIPVSRTALEDLGDDVELQIAVDRTFVPADVIAGSQDSRELGIQVHHAAPFPGRAQLP